MLSRKPTNPVLDKSHPLARGLVCDLMFDRPSGTIVRDISGNGNHGQVVGGGYAVDPVYGPYWRNSSSLISIPSSSTVDAITGAASLFIVSRCYDTTSASRYGKQVNFPLDGSPDYGLQNLANNYGTDGYVQAVTDAGTYTTTAGGAIRDGGWHVTVGVYDGTSVVHYEDGELIGSTAASGSIAQSSGYRLGTGATNNQVDLEVARCRLWNRGLSPDEVARLFADLWSGLQDGSEFVSFALPAASSYVPDLTSEGWTDLGTADRTVYVSSSDGSDSDDGLSEANAKATIAAGWALIRDGYADHLLLKRGDTWTDEYLALGKSGPSASSKMVVGAYGTGLRPKIVITEDESAVNLSSGFSNFALTSVEFAASGLYEGLNFGIRIVGALHDVLFEDVCISRFNQGMAFDFVYGGRASNVTIRRCVIYDNFEAPGGGHGQGIFVSECDNLVVEECFWDHNGWLTDRDTQATIYNHNCYLTYDNGPIVFRKNWSSRASSHAVQQRAGGEQSDNTFYLNAISGAVGWNTNLAPNEDGYQCSVWRNVTVGGVDITSSLPRGIGQGFSNAKGGDVEYNLVIHRGAGATGTQAGFGLASNNVQFDAVRFRRNLVYRWAAGVQLTGTGFTELGFSESDVQLCDEWVYQSASGSDADTAVDSSGNRFYSTNLAGDRYVTSGTYESNFAGWQSTVGDSTSTETDLSGTYTDPEKDMDDYAVSIGLADADALLTQIRLQRKGNWDLNLTPDRINAYFRANFDMRPAPSDLTATKDSLDVGLEWDAIPEASGYIIERRTDGGSWEQIGSA